MAQSGAQLSSLTAFEHGLPSIFEVIAQESLISVLKPAMKHIFRVMAQNNPERYSSLYQYSDELYSGLQLILESYYLKHYSASFSENFYGLKRISMKQTKDTGDVNKNTIQSESADGIKNELPTIQHLSTSQHLKSLFFLVVVPYVKSKCDLLYERLSSNQQEISQPQSQDELRMRLRRAYLTVYPLLHFLYQGTMMIYRLAYLFGKSVHHSPFLRLAGVLLLNLTPADMDAFSAKSNTPNLMELIKDRQWKQALMSLITMAFSTTSLMLSTGLSVGIFFLQFLDWWYTRDHDTTSILALPKPDCPKQHVLGSVPKHVTICPLCHRVRTNDTVLAVTGYVFCYPCIFRYVQEKQCCPITGYPATTEHLVKLFLNDI